MPAKSQAQAHLMGAKFSRGEISKKTLEDFVPKGSHIKNLPERVVDPAGLHVGGQMRKMRAPEGSPREERMESPAKEAAEQRKGGPMKNAAPLFTSKDGGNTSMPIRSAHSTTKHASHKGEPHSPQQLHALYGATKGHHKIG